MHSFIENYQQHMKLSIQNITKVYSNGVRALDDISLEMDSGMFGLLGPNGAGKSSLMRTIATLQQPDKGQISFNALDIFAHRHEFRKTLGFLPQEFGVYPKESAQSLLNYFAILKGVSSKRDRKLIVDQVLELTNLQAARKQRVSTFSGGMRQRFGIAQLLLNDPKLIIVDEPTAGLDPAERSRFLNVLRNISAENIVIFSTHLVEDVREMCKDMAIINKGRLISQDNPRVAVQSLKGKIWESSQSMDLSLIDTSQIKLSDRYDNNNQLIHRYYSEQSHEDLISVEPRLEDHYFLSLNRS